MKKNIYSIRKSKLGAVSTKIAAVTFLMLAGGVAVSELNTNVYAAETTQNKNEERKIESPVEYKGDVTKEVGYKEVKVQGNDGKIILKNNGNESTVERVEPTITKVDLGTKPKVETKIEKAKVEYKVDDTKNYGVKEVVKEPKDGEKTTTTTYKIVTKPKVKLSEKIENMLNSDNYMYTDEKFYSIDNSKELPSDKIVIDKLFVSIPEKQNIGEKIGVRELIQTGEYLVEEGKLKGKYITPEMMDPTNKDLRDIKRRYYGVDEEWENPIGYDAEKDTYDFSNDKVFYRVILKESSDSIIMLLGGHYLTNEVLKDEGEDKAVERYFAKHIITESMYADAKANYQRLQLAKQKLGELTESQKELVKNTEIAFNSITQHYNNINGYSNSLNITYEGNIPDNVKKEFEKQILKLPYEIRKNLVQLRVTTNDLAQTEHLNKHNSKSVGIANYYMKNIDLKYEDRGFRAIPTENGKKVIEIELKQPEVLLNTLMHEISHIIDVTGGLGSKYIGADGMKGVGTIDSDGNFSPYKLSSSKEFLDVYNKYFENEKNYTSYLRTSREEAFADSFGKYINKRIYGVPYTRYKNIDGVEYLFTDKNDSNYATATTPVDKAEYYFANLYNKLFEQPTEAKVVVDTINYLEKGTNKVLKDPVVQKVKLTRTNKVNKVTGGVTEGDWTEGSWEKTPSGMIENYKAPSIEVVEEKPVTSTTGNEKVDVYYEADTKEVPEEKEVTRTINYLEKGTNKVLKDPVVQKVKLTRTNKVNKVTGGVTEGDWTEGSWEKTPSGMIENYKAPSIEVVEEKPVTSTTGNEKVDVYYEADTKPEPKPETPKKPETPEAPKKSENINPPKKSSVSEKSKEVQKQKGSLAKTGQTATNTGIIGVGLIMLAIMAKRRKKR